MTNTDIDFLEIYKRVDRICADKYGTANGISEYIADMERNMSPGKSVVPSWEQTFRDLKHLRWVRNQMVHEPSFPGCEEDDLDLIETFYEDVMRARDPLAKLRRRQTQQSVKAHSISYQRPPASYQRPPEKQQPLQKPQNVDHNLYRNLLIVFVILFIIYILILKWFA